MGGIGTFNIHGLRAGRVPEPMAARCVGAAAQMIAIALLILLAIVCGYSWVAYRIKTSAPDINPTVPKPRDE